MSQTRLERYCHGSAMWQATRRRHWHLGMGGSALRPIALQPQQQGFKLQTKPNRARPRPTELWCTTEAPDSAPWPMALGLVVHAEEEDL